MLGVPDSVSRQSGDVHIFGNPHIHTSPINAKRIAANIAAGLERVDPQHAGRYREGLEAFRREIDRRLYGAELVDLLGSETLDPLASQGRLFDFLEGREYEGRPLIERLGGWLSRARAFTGDEIVAYHKNWIYFTQLLGLEVAGYVERKPGIPPSARHVHELLTEIQRQEIAVLLAASYFNRAQIETIAERSGCSYVIVDLGPAEIHDNAYFDLVETWVAALEAAFAAAGA